MKAVVYQGIGDIALETVSEPKLKQPTDAIIHITASAICGTGLYRAFDRHERGWIKVKLNPEQAKHKAA